MVNYTGIAFAAYLSVISPMLSDIELLGNDEYTVRVSARERLLDKMPTQEGEVLLPLFRHSIKTHPDAEVRFACKEIYHHYFDFIFEKEIPPISKLDYDYLLKDNLREVLKLKPGIDIAKHYAALAAAKGYYQYNYKTPTILLFCDLLDSGWDRKQVSDLITKMENLSWNTGRRE